MTKAITDSAINMIKSVQDEKPFFLYLSYTAPHWPLQAEAEDIAKFKGYYDGGWDEIRHKRLEKLNQTGLFSEKLVLSERNETIPEWNLCADKPTAIRKMEVYAAMIYRMDAEIGKLLLELKSKGLDKNTIIYFMSDNGACEEHGIFGFDRMKNNSEIGTEKSFVSYGSSWANVCNSPFRYFKEKTYEGGIRNPAIVYWPALANRKGTVVEKQTHLMDVLPTIAEIAGAKYPDKYNGHNIPKMDGISFLADLKGQNVKKHRFLTWEHEGNKAIIMGNFKCVKNRNGNWEMYNLKNDKTEMINIIENNKKQFNKLMKMYAHWEKSNGVVEFE
jgi:arylsulfatase